MIAKFFRAGQNHPFIEEKIELAERTVQGSPQKGDFINLGGEIGLVVVAHVEWQCTVTNLKWQDVVGAHLYVSLRGDT